MGGTDWVVGEVNRSSNRTATQIRVCYTKKTTDTSH